MASVRHVVVLGGSGFVGRHLLPRLLASRNRVTVLTRRLDARVRAAVPREASLREGDVYDDAFLRDCLDDADAVVNLTGILNERGDSGRGFQRVYVELLDALIEAMRATGVRRLLQMSALRAGEGDSHYLQARGRAEQHVRACGLDWTLLRASVIAGPGDGLFCRFAGLLPALPVLPLARAEARFQPVWVGDVAEAFARALERPDSIGQCYELAGPTTLTLREIVELTAHAQGRRRAVWALPERLGRWQAEIGEHLPGKPIGRDNLRSLQLDSVTDDNGLPKLGITPTDVRARLPEILAGC
ncbi:MAG TPA: complex I NDUFA9 subunit family protein [Lysobacter sp.]|nr:complex I NDUFA9 subunit family protein [Lysobacter sp.]